MNILAVINSLPLAFWSPGPGEMLVIAVIALLLYGGNLPEVARSWGKTFAEFRRGLNGFQSDLNEVIYNDPDRLPYYDESRYDESRYDESKYDESNVDDENRNSDPLDDGYDESEYAQPASTETEAKDASADDDTIIEDKPPRDKQS